MAKAIETKTEKGNILFCIYEYRIVKRYSEEYYFVLQLERVINWHVLKDKIVIE